VLGIATVVGVDLPGAVWILALGPVPTSVVSFLRLYGYSPRLAAAGLSLGVGASLVLPPLRLTLAVDADQPR
jgi:hypothetical protein